MHPAIFAHRGSSGRFAEHTRAAYLQALADGADGVECDVHLTRDRELVCIHDPRLDRTSDGTGDVASTRLKDLRSLDFSSWKGARIPAEYGGIFNQLLSLADLLDILLAARRPVSLAIELKHPSPFGLRLEEQLISFLLNRGWNPVGSTLGNITVSFMSFNPDSMRRLLEVAPQHSVCQLVADVNRDEVKGALFFGALAAGAVVNLMRRAVREGERLIRLHSVGIAGPGIKYVRDHPETVAGWIADGVRVRAWTVNTDDDAALVQQLGIHEITTDYPSRMRELLAGGTVA